MRRMRTRIQPHRLRTKRPLGDVKLVAGVGAWLPLEVIPVSFGIATCSALVTVIVARMTEVI
jgi:hypothetical protein